MSLELFKRSKKGTAVGAVLTRPESLRRMEQVSREDRPAIEAVGAEIARTVGNLDDGERKMVGRWVRELLGPRGLVPDRKGRVARGNLFTRGTIYRSTRPDNAPRSGAERLAAARAILATMPHPIMSADELIAERRRAFENGE